MARRKLLSTCAYDVLMGPAPIVVHVRRLTTDEILHLSCYPCRYIAYSDSEEVIAVFQYVSDALIQLSLLGYAIKWNLYS